MATIGSIGSGSMGGTIARFSAAAGHDVVLSNSRGPQTLTDLVQELGPRAQAAIPAEAAAEGNLVLVSVPQRPTRWCRSGR
jgi:8-hydroxy-5-deazaflavin:NADPH oxidoreductase